MLGETRTIPQLLYFTFLSILIALVFLIGGIATVSFSSVIVDNTVLGIGFIVLFWKGALVGFVVANWVRIGLTKEFATRFIGNYFGRFFGLLIGGLLGYEFARLIHLSIAIGILAGALGFYFVGRMIGSQVSILIGRQLDKIFSVAETPALEKTSLATTLMKISYAGAVAVVPLSLVVTGFLLSNIGFPVDSYVEWLPTARIVVTVFSIFSISLLWLIRRRSLDGLQTGGMPPEVSKYIFGLTVSILPAVYGFILFVVIGATVTELILFALTTSVTTIVWTAYNPVRV